MDDNGIYTVELLSSRKVIRSVHVEVDETTFPVLEHSDYDSDDKSDEDSEWSSEETETESGSSVSETSEDDSFVPIECDTIATAQTFPGNVGEETAAVEPEQPGSDSDLDDSETNQNSEITTNQTNADKSHLSQVQVAETSTRRIQPSRKAK